MQDTGYKTGNQYGSSYLTLNEAYEILAYIQYMQLRYSNADQGTQKDESTTTKLGTTSSYYTNVRGGPTDKWGYAVTPQIINSSTFGIRVRSNVTEYSEAIITNFGFSIPTTATINGIEIYLRQYYTRKPDGQGGYTYTSYQGYFQLKVYYTIPIVLNVGDKILAANHSGKVQANTITASEWSKTVGTIILQSHF